MGTVRSRIRRNVGIDANRNHAAVIGPIHACRGQFSTVGGPSPNTTIAVHTRPPMYPNAHAAPLILPSDSGGPRPGRNVAMNDSPTENPRFDSTTSTRARGHSP